MVELQAVEVQRMLDPVEDRVLQQDIVKDRALHWPSASSAAPESESLVPCHPGVGRRWWKEESSSRETKPIEAGATVGRGQRVEVFRSSHGRRPSMDEAWISRQLKEASHRR